MDEGIIFQGTFFCIITLDIRNPDTAQAALAKWMQLKTSKMKEAFLIVVGTFLDRSTERRISIPELCKECVKNDGIYIEVSNKDSSNIPLLRRLLCQRINYMIQVREKLQFHVPLSSNIAGTADDDFLQIQNNENFPHINAESSSRTPTPSSSGPLVVPFLDQDIMCGSVGSILSSVLGTKYYPGFGDGNCNEETESLQRIGDQLCELVGRLAVDEKTVPHVPMENSLFGSNDDEMEYIRQHMTGRPTAFDNLSNDIGGNERVESSSTAAKELQHAFDLMGFKVPVSSFSVSNIPSQSDNTKNALSHSTFKIRVRVPHQDVPSDLVIDQAYDIPGQIDAFLMQHYMEDDVHAREKIIDVAYKMVQERKENAEENATSPPVAALPARRTSKSKKETLQLQVQLPNGSMIMVHVRDSGDLVDLSQQIAEQYDLSAGFKQRILDQLQINYEAAMRAEAGK